MPVVRSKLTATKVQATRPQKVVRTMSLKDFYERRNKVLIFRGCGGLGDIFMHRMMFEDVKRLMPDAELHFACPKYYHEAVKDHPFIDRVLDSSHVDRNDYIAFYNTTTACGRAEMKLAPFSGPHRSDIWSAHCGFLLTKHNMHISLTDEEKAEGRRLIKEHRDRNGPCVIFMPVSAQENKNLLEHQIKGAVEGIRDRGLCVVGLHDIPIWNLLKNDIPMITTKKIRQWMGVIHEADYVLSVDTAGFHCAGGMGKPLVGVFTWADGEVYGKYYDFFLVQRHRNSDPNWTCGPCYNWGNCPKTKDYLKPCLTEITPEMILASVDKMLAKSPMKNST